MTDENEQEGFDFSAQERRLHYWVRPTSMGYLYRSSLNIRLRQAMAEMILNSSRRCFQTMADDPNQTILCVVDWKQKIHVPSDWKGKTPIHLEAEVDGD